MKAWRKHNMIHTNRAKELQEEANWLVRIGYDNAHPDVQALLAEARQHKSFMLRNAYERRTQYSAEQSTPSQLLYRIMYGPDWKKVVETISEILAGFQAQKMKDPYEGKYCVRVGDKWILPNSPAAK